MACMVGLTLAERGLMGGFVITSACMSSDRELIEMASGIWSFTGSEMTSLGSVRSNPKPDSNEMTSLSNTNFNIPIYASCQAKGRRE